MSEEILIRHPAAEPAAVAQGAVPAAAPLSAGAGAPLPIPPRRTAAGFAGCAGVRAAAMPCQS